MADPKPKEIIQAEELISKGKTEEALKIVREFQQSAWPYFYRKESNKALKIALQCKEFIEKKGEEIDIARNLLLLGWIFHQKAEFNTALDFGMKSVDFFKKIGDQVGLASSLHLVGTIHMSNYDFDLCINYFNDALSIKEINPIEKVIILSSLGNNYAIRGELPKAIDYSKQGLKLAEENKFINFIPSFLWYLGSTYCFRGDFSKGKKYLKKGLVEAKKINDVYIIGFTLLGLVIRNIELDSNEEAIEYLEQLKELSIKGKNRFIIKSHSVARGVFLQNSSRTRERAEAEFLLKEIVDKEIKNMPNMVLHFFASFFLCDLYLEELAMTNDSKIIEDINPLILQFTDYATKMNSNMLFIEIKVLKAKLELIQLNFEEAKSLLTEAQHLSELHNNQLFAQVISDEHDRLLEQQELWAKMEKTNTPFSERIRLAEFDGILDRIQGKRLEGELKLISEVPVFLLIITESGAPLFSYSFSQELSFEDDIISGFISAFNTFSGELFSKGLDRARFGEYIILIESVNVYSICYLFKGQSYPAKQKLTSLIEELKNNSTIWLNLEKFYKTSQVVELKDLPQIEDLIKEIFIT